MTEIRIMIECPNSYAMDKLAEAMEEHTIDYKVMRVIDSSGVTGIHHFVKLTLEQK